MSRKQSDYLAALLSDDDADAVPAPAAFPALSPATPNRSRGTTLLDRESALARVASGQVRQVTQLLLDPARVRVWPGNARSYGHLSESSCRELIESLVAEGGQKVPAVIRRVEGDPDHEYEVIAGTRRHWSVSWLRAHSYPDMMFVGQVALLDDEAAFRIADLENRARADVSDLERARNYAAALGRHYDGHLTRMAERLKLSKGWLSKMLKVAGLPDAIVGAFASPAEVQLKPAYPLARALDDRARAPAILAAAAALAREQQERRASERSPLPATEVLRRLLAASDDAAATDPYVWTTSYGRPLLTVQSSNRQGMTIRLHAGTGADADAIAAALRDTLRHLAAEGRGLRP